MSDAAAGRARTSDTTPTTGSPTPPSVSPALPALEALATAAAGGAIAAAVGAPLGLAVPVAVFGAANGAISGWRGVYRWGCADGWVAFVADSSWAIVTTSAGVVAHLGAAIRGRPGYEASLSRRANRHVYRRGFVLRRGFAVTLGNVVNGAGEPLTDRRRKLVTDHEDVHVWQSRWFGPLYPVLYGGWMALAGAYGALRWGWAKACRAEWAVRPSLGQTVETHAYYLNPFEWWAYSRDDHWPPRGKVPGVGWRRPVVRPFRRAR